MSTLFTAKEICEEALRKIGAYSLYDDAADGAELAEALSWLDLLVGFQSGKQRCFWFIPSTLSMTLTGGTASYNIANTLGTSAPANGLQFPVRAMLKDSNGNEDPLTIIRRDEYDEITDKDESGTPTKIYIDRMTSPTLYTWPVLGSGITGYSVELTAQTYGGDFHKGTGKKAHGLRPAWQMWAIYALAEVLGDGTIRRVPDREIAGFQAKAKDLEDQLFAYENREHQTTEHRVAYRDF